MNDYMPAVPKPVVKLLSYASTVDQAEQALSQIERSTTDNIAEGTISEKFCVKGASLSRSRTAVPAAISLRALQGFPRTLYSFLQSLWPKRLFQRQNVEKPLRRFKHENVNDFPNGYPQFAAFINSDENFSIFRKFGRASSRVLLHLQSEITALDKTLTELDRVDAKVDSVTAYRLASIKHEEGWDTTQRDTINQLQEKMVIYYDLLLKNNQVKALGHPLKHNHRYLFNWVEGKKPVIKEEDDWILHEDDLVALAPIDHLESSLADTCLNRLFHPSKLGGGNEEPVVTYFSHKRVTATAKTLNILIAVAILIIPISVLLWVHLDRAWMSVTVLLSVLVFSTLLSLSTTIKAKDIFLGTAAYVAVLATFLGNMLPRITSRTSNPG